MILVVSWTLAKKCYVCWRGGNCINSLHDSANPPKPHDRKDLNVLTNQYTLYC